MFTWSFICCHSLISCLTTGCKMWNVISFFNVFLLYRSHRIHTATSRITRWHVHHKQSIPVHNMRVDCLGTQLSVLDLTMIQTGSVCHATISKPYLKDLGERIQNCSQDNSCFEVRRCLYTLSSKFVINFYLLKDSHIALHFSQNSSAQNFVCFLRHIRHWRLQ